MRRYLPALPLIAIMAPVTAAQELTIPQAIERMKPGPYVVSRVREVDPLPFEHVVRDADLIVHCSLKKIRTYLSDTQMELFTDYQVIPFAVIAQRQLRASQRPGTQMPIVVRQWGGETTIDGVDVRIYDANISSLPTDTQLLLFLTHDNRTDKYEIFDAIAGAFELQNGRKLRHLMRPAVGRSYQHLKGADLAAVIQEIRQLGR